MNKEEVQDKRQFEIVLNYLSLIGLTFIFYYGKTHEFGYPLIGGGAITLIVTYLTFHRLHMKSGLWRLTHSKVEKT